ncbi:MAG: glycosyltransferase family 2 protein [Lachnospiraceae bacterium]|nr:glycosyltransferase family 2 protein [Lachnospiraceae bacterium]
MEASIAMATYNGESYISAQLDSILCQLDVNDEIVISDDGSIDSTQQIIKEYMLRDGRIKFFQNSKHGVVNNFENAILNTKKDIILLADQDDVWMPNKLFSIKKAMSSDPEIILVMHNFIEATNKEIEEKKGGINSFEVRNRKHGVINNLVKCGYWGCCMGFRSEVKKLILPFPKQLSKYDKHDIYISLVCEYYGRCLFIEEPLLYHRNHGDNVSQTLSVKNRFLVRFNLFCSVVETLIRNHKQDKKSK